MNPKSPRPLPSWILPLAALFLAGCETTSISDPGGYSASPGIPSRSRLYRGEIAEYELLGISGTNRITDDDILKALASAQPVRLRRGASLLLVQSGAIQPDEPLRSGLAESFKVVPFDGRPGDGGTDGRAVRLAAAHAGCDHIVACWGVLESASQQYGTELVSWVPLVGWAIPEQTRRTRMRLKVALIDTRTGSWSVFTTQPREEDATTGYLNRDSGRVAQVEKLKRACYAEAVKTLLDRHTD